MCAARGKYKLTKFVRQPRGSSSDRESEREREGREKQTCCEFLLQLHIWFGWKLSACVDLHICMSAACCLRLSCPVSCMSPLPSLTSPCPSSRFLLLTGFPSIASACKLKCQAFRWTLYDNASSSSASSSASTLAEWLIYLHKAVDLLLHLHLDVVVVVRFNASHRIASHTKLTFLWALVRQMLLRMQIANQFPAKRICGQI